MYIFLILIAIIIFLSFAILFFIEYLFDKIIDDGCMEIEEDEEDNKEKKS